MSRQRIGLLLALLGLLLAGCGGSSLGATATTTSTRASRPTIAPSPSPSATLPPVTLPPTCAQSLQALGAVQRGDLLIRFAFGLSYPWRQLPDGLSLSTPYPFTTQPAEYPAVDPKIADPLSGFTIEFCNAGASARHTLSAFSVSIQSFTPSTGQLDAWNPCSTTYTRQNGAAGGGCGGGVGDLNCLQATFPATAGSGATAAASYRTDTCTNATLPVTLTPNGDYFALLGVVMPTAIGAYTIALTYTVDGSPVSVPFADALLLAPVAHQWDGQACTTPAMLAQIPTTNPTMPYICPIA